MDHPLQSLFGLSLFFVIYTIAFNVVHILEEKQARIWERMTLSSIKRWEMYGGNLLYSFVMGYLQVVFVFMAFRFGAVVNFHGGCQNLANLNPVCLGDRGFMYVVGGNVAKVRPITWACIAPFC